MTSSRIQARRKAELTDEFATEVVRGLSGARKTLACRYFYDDQGSALFEEITRLPEYYQTRTEAAILTEHAADMCAWVEPGSLLIELGSGSSVKTEILLDELAGRVTYAPIDVSPSALDDAVRRLDARFPALDIRPVVGDFTSPPPLPSGFQNRSALCFFPGSTIGNFDRGDAAKLLELYRSWLPKNSRMLIGVDLKKEVRRLLLAYNDAAGVTAAFNLNLLHRINRELGAGLDISAFEHRAIYNPLIGRIEMHLVCRRSFEVVICGQRIRFAAGQSIHTENSCKYAISEFHALAREAGWDTARTWTDAESLFSVHELVSPAS
jgi:dimethylhistidine N-methyltransferase